MTTVGDLLWLTVGVTLGVFAVKVASWRVVRMPVDFYPHIERQVAGLIAADPRLARELLQEPPADADPEDPFAAKLSADYFHLPAARALVEQASFEGPPRPRRETELGTGRRAAFRKWLADRQLNLHVFAVRNAAVGRERYQGTHPAVVAPGSVVRFYREPTRFRLAVGGVAGALAADATTGTSSAAVRVAVLILLVAGLVLWFVDRDTLLLDTRSLQLAAVAVAGLALTEGGAVRAPLLGVAAVLAVLVVTGLIGSVVLRQMALATGDLYLVALFIGPSALLHGDPWFALAAVVTASLLASLLRPAETAVGWVRAERKGLRAASVAAAVGVLAGLVAASIVFQGWALADPAGAASVTRWGLYAAGGFVAAAATYAAVMSESARRRYIWGATALVAGALTLAGVPGVAARLDSDPAATAAVVSVLFRTAAVAAIPVAVVLFDRSVRGAKKPFELLPYLVAGTALAPLVLEVVR